MRRRRFAASCAIAALIVVFGAALDGAPSAEPAGELLVIVHPDNRAQITGALLEDLFLRRQIQWSEGDRAIPLNAPPDAERRQAFDRAVLRMSPDEVARYWLDQRIRGVGTAPREVAEPALTVKLIAKVKAAVGYVPSAAVNDEVRNDIRIVARVRDGKLILP